MAFINYKFKRARLAMLREALDQIWLPEDTKIIEYRYDRILRMFRTDVTEALTPQQYPLAYSIVSDMLFDHDLLGECPWSGRKENDKTLGELRKGIAKLIADCDDMIRRMSLCDVITNNETLRLETFDASSSMTTGSDGKSYYNVVCTLVYRRNLIAPDPADIAKIQAVFADKPSSFYLPLFKDHNATYYMQYGISTAQQVAVNKDSLEKHAVVVEYTLSTPINDCITPISSGSVYRSW